MCRKLLLALGASLLSLAAAAQGAATAADADVALTDTIEAADDEFEAARRIDVFNNVYKLLDLYYVDTLSHRRNVQNAIDYMLAQLDPYTEVYAEDETDDLKQMTTGKYAGVGAIITYRQDLGRCIIETPYEGQPAAEAGLRRADVILAIDGVEMTPAKEQTPADFSSYVSENLRGEPGTQLTVRVQRTGHDHPLDFRLTRRAIELPSVELSTLLPDSVGYISLTTYSEHTARDVRRALLDLKAQGARSLVLDLRGNVGGLMTQAVEVVNLFVPRGREVLSTRGKVAERNITMRTTREPVDTLMPLAVLVDFGTASAAEITAGALQDYDRAVVVGRRTYGKGLVQETHTLPYDNVLKLTTSRYYIPSGRCVQAYTFKDGVPQHLPDSLARTFYTAAGRPVRDCGGIAPDVEVPLDSLPTLLTYLAVSDQLTDYVAHFRATHDAIAAPSDFRLTQEEYADFCRFMKEHGFTYDRQSRSVLELLRSVAQREGYAEEAKAEFDALEAKLTHDADFDFARWEDDIRFVVEGNIVSDYYYQRGTALFGLRDCPELDAALAILRDADRLGALLAPPAQAER